jgi:hypothetical protein
MLILDTPPEERFDRIVEFAAAEFGVPTALISLADVHEASSVVAADRLMARTRFDAMIVALDDEGEPARALEHRPLEPVVEDHRHRPPLVRW